MGKDMLFSLFDVIAPRHCAICGIRLSPDEALVCLNCDRMIEQTDFCHSPYDNAMARLFWGQMPVEKASAWFYYHSHGAASKMIYDMKYHNQPLLGEDIGEQLALRHRSSGFFEGIDAIVPMPLTKHRRWQRGYNQSEQLAHGMAQVTHLPVYEKVVRRVAFSQSQTQQNSWERRENVREAFRLVDEKKIRGKHLLIVDDIVTTGASVIACGQQLAQAEGVRLSVLSVGFTKE